MGLVINNHWQRFIMKNTLSVNIVYAKSLACSTGANDLPGMYGWMWRVCWPLGQSPINSVYSSEHLAVHTDFMIRGEGGQFSDQSAALLKRVLTKRRARGEQIEENWARPWMHFDLFNTVLWLLYHTAFQAAVTWDMAPLLFLLLLRGYWLTKIIPAQALAAYIKMTSCDIMPPERSWHFNKV